MAQQENIIVNELATLLSKKLNIGSVARVAEALQEQIKFLTVSVEKLDSSIVKMSRDISQASVKIDNSSKNSSKFNETIGNLNGQLKDVVKNLTTKYYESNPGLEPKDKVSNINKSVFIGKPTSKETELMSPGNTIKKFQEKIETKPTQSPKPLFSPDDPNSTGDILATLKSIQNLLQPKQEIQKLTAGTPSQPKISDILKELQPFLVTKQDLQRAQQPNVVSSGIPEKRESTNLTRLQPSSSVATKSSEIKPSPEFKSELKPEEKIQKVTIDSFSSNAIKSLKINEEAASSQKKLEIIKTINKNLEENFKKILDKIGPSEDDDEEDDSGNNGIVDALKDQVLDRISSKKGKKGKKGSKRKVKGAATAGRKSTAAAGRKATAAAGRKAATKAGEKAAAKAGEKVAAKAAAKAGEKAVGKSLLKKLPGFGALAGAAFSVGRAMEGDFLGAAGELASGVLGSVPVIGTAASTAIDAALLVRDVKNASSEENPEEKQKLDQPVDLEKKEKSAQLAADVELNKKQEVSAAASQEKLQTLLEKSKTESLNEDEVKEAKRLATVVGIPTREISKILSKNSSQTSKSSPQSSKDNSAAASDNSLEERIKKFPQLDAVIKELKAADTPESKEKIAMLQNMNSEDFENLVAGQNSFADRPAWQKQLLRKNLSLMYRTRSSTGKTSAPTSSAIAPDNQVSNPPSAIAPDNEASVIASTNQSSAIAPNNPEPKESSANQGINNNSVIASANQSSNDSSIVNSAAAEQTSDNSLEGRIKKFPQLDAVMKELEAADTPESKEKIKILQNMNSEDFENLVAGQKSFESRPAWQKQLLRKNLSNMYRRGNSNNSSAITSASSKEASAELNSLSPNATVNDESNSTPSITSPEQPNNNVSNESTSITSDVIKRTSTPVIASASTGPSISTETSANPQKSFSTMEMYLERIANNSSVSNQNISGLIMGFNNLTRSLENVLGERLNVPPVINTTTPNDSPKTTSAQYANLGNSDISSFRTSVVEGARFRPA